MASPLCELAAANLVRMFDPEKQIFCDTYIRTENGMRRERVSHRYTMMTSWAWLGTSASVIHQVLQRLRFWML